MDHGGNVATEVTVRLWGGIFWNTRDIEVRTPLAIPRRAHLIEVTGGTSIISADVNV